MTRSWLTISTGGSPGSRPSCSAAAPSPLRAAADDRARDRLGARVHDRVRARRDQPLPHPPKADRLHRTMPMRQTVRRERPPRTALKTRTQISALGADRSRPARRPPPPLHTWGATGPSPEPSEHTGIRPSCPQSGAPRAPHVRAPEHSLRRPSKSANHRHTPHDAHHRVSARRYVTANDRPRPPPRRKPSPPHMETSGEPLKLKDHREPPSRLPPHVPGELQ
jgi:hypothetical protein